jgi:hypothetical protein
MPSITNLVATTETEALNIMLSAIGEAPVANIDTATAADAVMAKNILRSTAKDILAEGWRFNTEFGYELAPTTTQPWVGSDGSAATLNVFEVPTNLIRFRVTPCDSQSGGREVDVVARQGRTYDPTKIIFYDRAKNRDGLDSAQYTVLFIDPVWYFDFEKCPESIRKLITVAAARRLAAEATNAPELVQFTQLDEAQAFRIARRDQGEQDTFTMLNEATVGAVLGRRLYRGYGRRDTRNSPRKV